MDVKTDILHEIIDRFETGGIIDDGETRHQRQARVFHEAVYGLNAATITDADQIQLLFDNVIAARAFPLSEGRYDELSAEFTPADVQVVDFETAISNLLAYDDIGQKIANEFLRQYVHVFNARSWTDRLEVPLDTHVLNGLAKTDAIPSRDAVTTRRGGTAETGIAYDHLQAALHEAATANGYPRIIFDELWVEHKYYLDHDNPAIRRRSCLTDLTS